ncbi:transposase [Tuwongella immobilis]|uniref:transposase n=1 Tax=Tuwongella immobilis TaxID=692036 RepID=UPI0013A6DCD5
MTSEETWRTVAFERHREKLSQVRQQLGVSEQSFYRWRNQYGGMNADEARRLRELEAENEKLKQIVAE